MTDYYQILGVSRGASTEEIKRAYRKLALRFHPDKTNDPAAHERIKEINEAYDVLGDPEKKRSYDLGSYKPLVDAFRETESSPAHRDPAYRRRRPPVSRKNEKSSLQELKETYMPFMSKVSLTAFIFCMVLMIDYALPFRKTVEKIVDSYTYQGIGMRNNLSRSTYMRSEIIVTNESNRYRISSLDYSFHIGDLIHVSSSRFFRIPVFIESDKVAKTEFKATIYRNFIFMPLVLLITSGLGVFLKRNFELRFNLGIVNAMLFLLNLFFLFSHKFFV